MKFTFEQILSFAKNWKQFHADGKHKKIAYTMDWLKPPQIGYRTALTTAHYVFYNYLRNLPLERGIEQSNENWEYLITSIPGTYNNPFNTFYLREQYSHGTPQLEESLKGFQAIYGEGITSEILMDFKQKCLNYIKPVDSA